jgi:cyclohexanecarboxylate-CoA ligase
MIEAQTFWELVEGRAAETPDAQMVVDEAGSSLTFAQYKDRGLRIAAGLAARGVGEGSVVSWQLPTWLDSMALVGALARLGALQNPIIPIYREREVGFILRQARTGLVIVPGTWRGFDYEAMVRPLAGDAPILIADRTLPEGDPSTLKPFVPSSSVRWLFYTSGTTAEPKGAQHTDATIFAAARVMVDRLALVDSDRNALCFPFTHVGGIIWLTAGLMVGLTNIIDEAFDPVSTTELLQRERVTLAGSGTFFHMAYLKAQRANPAEPLFPNVRAFPGGGAPKPPQLHYDLRAEIGGVGITAGYGLTEAPILTMASVNDSDEVLAKTEGRAATGVSLRLVTLDGAIAEPGEEGEIRAKGPQVMLGYLDSALDAEAFDDDGWFRTGDLGRLDDDGNVTITGRVKDIIIRKGENISAKEVEDLLFTHPNVADVAVVGLPDPSSGEIACAVVVPNDTMPSLGDLTSFLASKGLRTHALPERLELVDALPRNPAGKVLKQDLKKRFT